MSYVLNDKGKEYEALRSHVPEEAVEGLWAVLGNPAVRLRVAGHRRTLLGVYRAPRPGRECHEISVNGDLGRGMFLWVLLHELAHLDTRLRFCSARPHGHEWQAAYARLLMQYVEAFPEAARPLVRRFAERVPLRRAVGAEVERVLRREDGVGDPDEEWTMLDRLQPGDRFRMRERPKAVMEAVERRRTRWLCAEPASGRLWLVAGRAEVRMEKPGEGAKRQDG